MADRGFHSDVEAELLYQLKMTEWYARLHPNEAARLGMRGGKVTDPAIREMIGANALCTAEARRYSEGLFPQYVREVLGVVRPLLGMPLPSFAVFQIRTDRIATRFDLPARTSIWPKIEDPKLSAESDGWAGVCYELTAPLAAWAVATKSAKISNEKPEGSFATPEGTAAWLHLTVAPTGKVQLAGLAAAGLDSLRFYLASDGTERGQELFRSITGDALAVFARTGSGEWKGIAVAPAAEFAVPDELLWPKNANDDRILTEGGLFPQKRLFVDFLGFKSTIEKAESGAALELAVALGRPPVLPNVGRGDFALGCVPALNLFQQEESLYSRAKNSAPALKLLDNFKHSLDLVRVTRVETMPDETPCEPYYGGKFAYGDLPATFYHLVRATEDPTPAELVDSSGAVPVRKRIAFLRVLAPTGRPMEADRQLRVNCLCSHGDRPHDQMTTSSPSWYASNHEFGLATGPSRSVPLRSRIEAPKWLHAALTTAECAFVESADATDELKGLLALMPAEYGAVQIFSLVVRATRRAEFIEGIPILRRGRRVEVELAGSAAYPFAIAFDEYLQRTTDAGTYTETSAAIYGASANGTVDRDSGWQYELPTVGNRPKKISREGKS